MAPPHAAARRQVGGGQLVLGEPRNGALRRFGPFESPTQVGEDAFEDEQVRPAGARP